MKLEDYAKGQMKDAKFSWKPVVENELIVAYQFCNHDSVERTYTFDEINGDFHVAQTMPVDNHYFSFGIRQSMANLYAGYIKKELTGADILQLLDTKWADICAGNVTSRKPAELKLTRADMIKRLMDAMDMDKEAAEAQLSALGLI